MTKVEVRLEGARGFARLSGGESDLRVQIMVPRPHAHRGRMGSKTTAPRRESHAQTPTYVACHRLPVSVLVSAVEVESRAQALADAPTGSMAGRARVSATPVDFRISVELKVVLLGDPALVSTAAVDPRVRVLVDLVQAELMDDQVGSVLTVRALVGCRPALSNDPVPDSGPVSCLVWYQAQVSEWGGSEFQVLSAGSAGSLEVWNPDDYPVRKVYDYPDDSLDAVVDSRSDDNANCRDSPADSPKQSVVDDTKVVADDKDSTILPNTHGCNKHGVLPSSNPIRPSPKADC